MKKNVLIAYLNNGNIQSQIAKEMMFQKLLTEMMEEGREVGKTTLQPLSKSVLFDDGSKLYCYPISSFMRGLKATHVFIDDNITHKPNGMRMIKDEIMYAINWESQQFDTSGSRLNFFSMEEDGLVVTNKTL